MWLSCTCAWSWNITSGSHGCEAVSAAARTSSDMGLPTHGVPGGNPGGGLSRASALPAAACVAARMAACSGTPALRAEACKATTGAACGAASVADVSAAGGCTIRSPARWR